MRYPLPYFLLLILLSFVSSAFIASAHAQTTPSEPRCFAETGFCINGRIREVWEQSGAMRVFGLPITPQQEQNIAGQTVQVQWFERYRLELHPDQAAPYDVLPGTLGAERLTQRGQDWRAFPQSTARSACRFFAETGHNLCGEMYTAWRAHGLEFDGRIGTSEMESLALFGMPLSDVYIETLSDGNQYAVQWFERARFELHPQNPPPFRVLFGLLSMEKMEETEGAPEAATIAPDTPTADLVSVMASAGNTQYQYVFPVRADAVDYGPYHHDYPAADIFTSTGNEFLATTDGIVDWVSLVDTWSPATNRPEERGGISVAIIGDDGLRYYGSHLSAVADAIEPGKRVVAGQLLGLTGISGNARGTPPHVHYGISRPTTPDDWQVRRGEIPPYTYLKAWERGESVTPGF